jgi:hypothetical protein
MPLAANAMTAPPLNQMQTQAHKTVSSVLSKVQFAVEAQSYSQQSLVQTGSNNQKYPDSVGG